MRRVWETWLIKALLQVGLAEALLPLVGRVPPWPALLMALAVAALTYGLADRLLLQTQDNGRAVLADFLLAVPALRLLGLLLPGVQLPFGGALTVGGAMAVGEILYHQYLLSKGVGVR